ncbi:unnamed protein product [Paramecium sonneborni]|uniref:Uncharacterized protein n=1 Tax=Paramecium sonneborni TaxID=65129 RepID=A0A8S1LS66_9CILI|nr:unnamed protein product [Paramecium sonneborni]
MELEQQHFVDLQRFLEAILTLILKLAKILNCFLIQLYDQIQNFGTLIIGKVKEWSQIQSSGYFQTLS